MTLDRQISLLKRPRPAAWQFDGELLDLLWVLEHTFDLWPSLDQAIAYEVEKVEKNFPKQSLGDSLGIPKYGSSRPLS